MPRPATQAEVSNPKRKGYDFRIDNHLYRAAISSEVQMQIQSSDVEGQDINVNQNAEDFTKNIGRIYSRNNFSGGSNLDMAHKRGMAEGDVTRFWDSSGVDVFTQNKGTPYSLKMLFQTELEQALSSSDGDNHMAIVGTRIYVSDDEVLYKSDDGGDTWSTVTEGLTAGYNIKGLAAHGDLLYIVANNGSAGEIENLTSGGTSTQKMSAAIYDGIWSVKGLMLVSTGTTLHQYDGNTTVGSAIETLPSGQSWTDVVDAGAVILAVASDGRIYSIKDSSGTFAAAGTTELKGEVATCITETQGQVFYGTKVTQTGSKVIGRLYSADLTVANDLYVLGNQQLIKEWNIDSIDASPYRLYSTRDSVYTGIKETADNSYLWRYYLPTAGIARDLKLGAGNVVKCINSINEKFLASVQGSGVYQETSNYEQQGYLITANADFFTAEKKQWVEAQIETQNISAGHTVELHVSDDIKAITSSTHSSWDRVLNLQSGSGTVSAQVDKISRYGSIKVVLNSAGTNTAPEVNSIQYRALARPELVMVQIPVNISDRVERPFRKPITVPNLGETIYQSLKDKEGTPVTLEIYDPQEIIRGVVEKIQYPIQSNPNFGSVTRYAIITIRGTRQEVYATLTSGNAPGINAYGIMRFG
tara:strand:+ start:7314 stop:9242 length:1929 start_codon:yes stop_codon:yes gene_type:complete